MQIKKSIVMVLGLLWCAATPAGLWASEAMGPVGLTCEYRENPLGIDVVKPRLGWKTGEKSEVSSQKPEQSEIGNRKFLAGLSRRLTRSWWRARKSC